MTFMKICSEILGKTNRNQMVQCLLAKISHMWKITLINVIDSSILIRD